MRTPSFLWSIVLCSIFNLVVDSAAISGELPKIRESETNTNSANEVVEIRDFEVRVDNKPAGTHRLTIKSDGDKHEVAFQTDVKMDFVIYAYVFKSRGTEIWRDGRLENAEIRCEDGGKKRSLALKTEGNVQKISFNGKSVSDSAQGLMTTAYWKLPSADVRKNPLTIVDVDSGATRTVTLSPVGRTRIASAGQMLDCHHFKIDGPSPAELWFDEQDRLVRQTSVEVGHELELKLKEIRALKPER